MSEADLERLTLLRALRASLSEEQRHAYGDALSGAIRDLEAQLAESPEQTTDPNARTFSFHCDAYTVIRASSEDEAIRISAELPERWGAINLFEWRFRKEIYY